MGDPHNRTVFECVRRFRKMGLDISIPLYIITVRRYQLPLLTLGNAYITVSVYCFCYVLLLLCLVACSTTLNS